MRFDTSSECCYSERLVRINGPFPRSPAYGFLVTDNPFIRRRLAGNQPLARTTDSADDHLGTVASHRIGGEGYSSCRCFNLALDEDSHTASRVLSPPRMLHATTLTVDRTQYSLPNPH